MYCVEREREQEGCTCEGRGRRKKKKGYSTLKRCDKELVEVEESSLGLCGRREREKEKSFDKEEGERKTTLEKGLRFSPGDTHTRRRASQSHQLQRSHHEEYAHQEEGANSSSHIFFLPGLQRKNNYDHNIPFVLHRC